MSTVHLHYGVKKFLHQCQPGVGRWSIMGKNLVNVVKERVVLTEIVGAGSPTLLVICLSCVFLRDRIQVFGEVKVYF